MFIKTFFVGSVLVVVCRNTEFVVHIWFGFTRVNFRGSGLARIYDKLTFGYIFLHASTVFDFVALHFFRLSFINEFSSEK